MDIDRIHLMEHLAIDCRLSLHEFCNLMQSLFNLPDFEYDCENETEWGRVEHQGIEYNVSRPYKRGTLEEWDGSVPVGCNIGVTLIAFNDCPPGQDIQWNSSDLTERVARRLAQALRRPVYHHRTWFAPGRDVTHKTVFRPQAKRG